MLAEIYGDLADLLAAAVRGILNDAEMPGRENAVHLHDDLLAAIRAGDPAAAQDAAAGYLDTMLSALRALDRR
jgi:DNA-binding FadR family transcriptional regulator